MSSFSRKIKGITLLFFALIAVASIVPFQASAATPSQLTVIAQSDDKLGGGCLTPDS